MTRLRYSILLFLAMCVALGRAQVTEEVVPDIVEAITRVVKAEDFQQGVQILGEYGFMPGYFDKRSGTIFFDMDAGIMHGHAYLCPALQDRNKIGMISICSNYNLRGVMQRLEEFGMELSQGYKPNLIWCQWGELYGSLEVWKSRREFELEFRLRPFQH